MLAPREGQMTINHDISRTNNFDIVRIVAALQVVFGHAIKDLEVDNAAVSWVNDHIAVHFPGVPMFFVLSGMLIYASFARNSTNIKKFFWHRAVRIFPALWVCVAITVALIVAQTPLSPTDFFTDPKLGAWLFGSFTIFQAYTPEVLRQWATGVPNGALWTIAVEIEFYVLVPLMVLVTRPTLGRWKHLVPLAAAVSILINAFVGSIDPDSGPGKVGGVFLGTYLYYFIMGVYAYRHWPTVRTWVEGRFGWWIGGYVAYYVVFSDLLGLYEPSYFIKHPLNLGAHVLLAGVTLSAAFSMKTLSGRLLRHYDISYGVYIYHLVIINVLVHYGHVGSAWNLAAAVVLSIAAGLASWVLIEQRALRLKTRL